MKKTFLLILFFLILPNLLGCTKDNVQKKPDFNQAKEEIKENKKTQVYEGPEYVTFDNYDIIECNDLNITIKLYLENGETEKKFNILNVELKNAIIKGDGNIAITVKGDVIVDVD